MHFFVNANLSLELSEQILNIIYFVLISCYYFSLFCFINKQFLYGESPKMCIYLYSNSSTVTLQCLRIDSLFIINYA